MNMRNLTIVLFSAFTLVGCATLTNEENVPVSLSFSNGGSGSCKISNKRMSIEEKVPGTVMVRRSDDNLNLDCKVEGGKTATASIPSTIGAKIIASALFMDLGITDSITDKHREYPASYVIPVQ